MDSCFGFADIDWCTASLIAPSFVLTAAHCVSEDGDANGWYAYAVQGCPGFDPSNWGHAFRVSRVMRHSSYKPIRDDDYDGYDIAILELEEPMHHVIPVCLPFNHEIRFDNLVMAGCGLVNGVHDHLKYNGCLNEAEVAVVPDSECQRHFYVARDRVLCAGGESGSCRGDSGGPLMTRKSGRLVQVGISSFSRRDCGVETKTPHAFERLAFHLPWIHEHTNGSTCHAA